MNLLLRIAASASASSAATCKLTAIDPMWRIFLPGDKVAPPGLVQPLAAARGETIHVQALLYDFGDRPMGNKVEVSARVHGLVGAQRVRSLVYIELDKTYMPDSLPGRYPDPLVDGVPIDQGKTELALTGAETAGGVRFEVYWITIDVPLDATAGYTNATVDVLVKQDGIDGAAKCTATFDLMISKWKMDTTARGAANPVVVESAFKKKYTLKFAPVEELSPKTALSFFKTMANQGLNSLAFGTLAALPWAPTVKWISAKRDELEFNWTGFTKYWPTVLSTVNPAYGWRIPFSTALVVAGNNAGTDGPGDGSGKGLAGTILSNNATWRFWDATGAAYEQPIFAGPPFNGTIHPTFEKDFTLLFTGVTSYMKEHKWLPSTTIPEPSPEPSKGRRRHSATPSSEQRRRLLRPTPCNRTYQHSVHSDWRWVEVLESPAWEDLQTVRNLVALMHLYKKVMPFARIFQKKFPISLINTPTMRELYLEVFSLVNSWSVPAEVYAVSSVRLRIAEMRAISGVTHNPLFLIDDNGIPLIEAPRERARFQAYNVVASNGTLNGLISFSKMNMYGAFPGEQKPAADPWQNPNPNTKGEPAGLHYLLWPPPPGFRDNTSWAPLDSLRWVMSGAGLQDARYLQALQARASSSSTAKVLLAEAFSMSAGFPVAWHNKSDPHRWRNDGYLVDHSQEQRSGSGTLNVLKLRMGSVLGN